MLDSTRPTRDELPYLYKIHLAERAKKTVEHKRNHDEDHYDPGLMSFTKGLEHDGYGRVSKKAFDAFRAAIDGGEVGAFEHVPVYEPKDRDWEAPTAGMVMDTQGPDAQSVTMAPAPALNEEDGTFDELAFEMAEVYELALLRDLPFDALDGDDITGAVRAAVDRLNAMPFAQAGFPRRRRTTVAGQLTTSTVFRGSTYGVADGPYLSSLMLMGNGEVTEGQIAFGNQTIDQRVRLARPRDYMVDQKTWLEVQNGVQLRNNSALFTNDRRFMHTPRDLATYVHDDALYQAYLNACLILLGMQAPLDPRFDKLSGSGDYAGNNVTGFALYGGPHILSLVTEVATRGLKAVRYQKFNTHLRLRPETLAGRVVHAEHLHEDFGKLRDALDPELLAKVKHHNAGMGGDHEAWLPMAFQEGSPMHPSYGAGHATVAGACVTVLKAFFDTRAVLQRSVDGHVAFKTPGYGEPVKIVSVENGRFIRVVPTDTPLTLLGELNKLAANISIGRNMAGVHYYSDYFDSLRMGEEIAHGMMQDQADGYPVPDDPFTMAYVPFDDLTPADDHDNRTVTRDPYAPVIGAYGALTSSVTSP